MAGGNGEGKRNGYAGRADILGLPVDRFTLRAAAAAVSRAWSGGKFFHVVTANAEMLHRGIKDGELGAIIASADMVTADGAGVVLASHILSCPVPERVAGYDLMMECLREAAGSAVPVYLLGARPEVLESAVERARELFPGLNVVGRQHGYFNAGDQDRIIAEICSRKPSLLLVALGVPRQEKWIYRYKEKLPPCVAVGVGGSLDVLAGRARRAPLWMQRAGLEWFYRLLKEPSRARRMLSLPLFLLAVLGQALRKKRPR